MAKDLQSFIEAIQKGDQAAVERRLEQDASLAGERTAQGLSMILLAAYYDQPALAQLLADYNPALDIFEASALGDLEQVRQLLSDNPERVNAVAPDGYQPLGLACFFGHTRLASYLLSMGATVDSHSQNSMQVMPLHSAVASQNMEIARMLLAAGAPVDAQQAGGFTPLHGAAQNGQLPMVRLLIEYGAEPLLTNQEGKTAYDLALQDGKEETANYLKELM